MARPTRRARFAGSSGPSRTASSSGPSSAGGRSQTSSRRGRYGSPEGPRCATPGWRWRCRAGALCSPSRGRGVLAPRAPRTARWSGARLDVAGRGCGAGLPDGSTRRPAGRRRSWARGGPASRPGAPVRAADLDGPGPAPRGTGRSGAGRRAAPQPAASAAVGGIAGGPRVVAGLRAHDEERTGLVPARSSLLCVLVRPPPAARCLPSAPPADPPLPEVSRRRRVGARRCRG
ncbi:MAG: hypothetical protein JWP64_1611 [Pseudonocardia sp.]|nr:hypothetical protein [Pseudonocardia sp.]